MTKYEVSFGNKTICFSLERRDRKTMEISVLPDLSIRAIAPRDIAIEDVITRVKKRAPWILKQQNYFLRFTPREPPRRFVSGETHRYLGRQYRLKIISSEKDNVKLSGKYIVVSSKKSEDPDYNKRLLYIWYRKNARKHFEQRLDRCLDIVGKYGVKRPTLQILTMKSRWGSCPPSKNKLLLNIELIRVPSHCAEYVIMHELCHLKHPEHDKRFYNFLSLVMPDWKERKERLEKVVIRL